MTNIAEREFLNAADLARRYTVSVRTIKRWTKAGILPNPLKVSDVWLRYDVEECDAALARRSAELQREAAQ